MKNVAISGCDGFVGKHLLDFLKNKNFNIFPLTKQKGYDLNNEINNYHLPKLDVILHLAAKSFVPDSFNKPYTFYQNNFISTLNILELAKKNNTRIIFFSTYIYGNPKYLPIDELHSLNPTNPYAQSKLICEELCKGYSRDFNIPIIIVRPFNIYGVGQKTPFLIPEIIHQAKNGKIILSDSRPKRDFIHVNDIIEAINILINIEIKENEYQIFNLGSGKSYSVDEIANLIISLIDPRIKINYLDNYRKGEILETISNNDKIFKLTGWKSKTDLKDGLREIIDHI
jgi:nucleoside-diphosphate-sugar epimerase